MARVNPFAFLFRPYPTYYIIFVTARCNCRCAHCFYHKEIASADKASELTLEEYRRISRSLGLVKAVAITGGEPSLRDDVVDICDIFGNVNKAEYLSFHTNGLLVEKIKGIAGDLLRRLPDTFIMFELSIDGLFEEHDRLRNSPGLFRKNLELIEFLASLKPKHKNFAIEVNAVYSAANKDKIPEIEAFCSKLPLDGCDLGFIRGDVGESPLKQVDAAEFIRVANKFEPLRELRKSSLALGSFVGIVEEMRLSAIREIYRSRKMPFHCVAGEKMLVISEQGRVRPCELLGTSFGELRENAYDIRRVLDSERARNILADIRAKKCFCTWECAITDSIVHDPSRYPEMLVRWLLRRVKGI